MAESFRCALLLLAAGGSRRMGQPKQLLPIDGQPLLRRVAAGALAAPVAPVLVVLGAQAAAIAPCLDGLAVQTVVNARWAEGMATSVRAGLQALANAAPAVSAVVIALADQPDFSAAHLAALIETHRRTGQPLVASEAAGVLRPPVLFAAAWFPRLLALQGDEGARTLLQAHRAAVAVVPLARAVDLDTPADYEKFLRDRT